MESRSSTVETELCGARRASKRRRWRHVEKRTGGQRSGSAGRAGRRTSATCTEMLWTARGERTTQQNGKGGTDSGSTLFHGGASFGRWIGLMPGRAAGPLQRFTWCWKVRPIRPGLGSYPKLVWGSCIRFRRPDRGHHVKNVATESVSPRTARPKAEIRPPVAVFSPFR